MVELKMMRNRKAQLDGASGLAVGLVVLALIVSVGAIVLGDVRATEAGGASNAAGGCDLTNASNQASCSVAVNVTTDGMSGLNNMSAQFGTVGTVAIAAVLIALVVAAFVIRARP